MADSNCSTAARQAAIHRAQDERDQKQQHNKELQQNKVEHKEVIKEQNNN